MEKYYETIEALYDAAAPLIEPGWRQLVREFLDMAEDMDAVEDLLDAAAKASLRLPKSLVADIETYLIPHATRPPQDQLIADSFARVKALSK